jgi:hypothetical protein
VGFLFLKAIDESMSSVSENAPSNLFSSSSPSLSLINAEQCRAKQTFTTRWSPHNADFVYKSHHHYSSSWIMWPVSPLTSYAALSARSTRISIRIFDMPIGRLLGTRIFMWDLSGLCSSHYDARDVLPSIPFPRKQHSKESSRHGVSSSAVSQKYGVQTVCIFIV